MTRCYPFNIFLFKFFRWLIYYVYTYRFAMVLVTNHNSVTGIPICSLLIPDDNLILLARISKTTFFELWINVEAGNSIICMINVYLFVKLFSGYPHFSPFIFMWIFHFLLWSSTSVSYTLLQVLLIHTYDCYTIKLVSSTLDDVSII